MLPPEHRTPQVMELQQFVKRTAETEFFKFPPLRKDDIHLLGCYIHLYNFMDLNLRRCVEIFARADKLPSILNGKYKKMPVSGLVPTIKEVVSGMNQQHEDVADSLGKLDEIEFRRGFRNLFAHWAAKRFPEHEAILFLTKDERDAKNVLGDELEFDSLANTVLMLADIRGLTTHMVKYEEWIAKKTTDWHRRYLA